MRSNTKTVLQIELTDSDKLSRCARQCGVMGDLNKLKICYLLRHHPELSVTQIAEVVGTSVSNVSHSLAKLRSLGFVRSRREAQTVYYSLDKKADPILQLIS